MRRMTLGEAIYLSINKSWAIIWKEIVVVGGTSGIGFGVAKLAVLNQASDVVVASSTKDNVDSAVQKLRDIVSDSKLSANIMGAVVDSTDSKSIKALFESIGEIDHLVWTSGSGLKLGYPKVDLEDCKDLFDMKFWSVATAAQVAKFRPGGSITLTTGSTSKPPPGWSLVLGMGGAVEALTRGLAVDLAPVRVNNVSPGLVNTERIAKVGYSPEAQEKLFADRIQNQLIKHIAAAEEVAEAYLFCMKCGYITGLTILVDGGSSLV